MSLKGGEGAVGAGGNIITNPEGERIEVITQSVPAPPPPPAKQTLVRRPCMYLARWVIKNQEMCIKI